jgi:hypothetical protein
MASERYRELLGRFQDAEAEYDRYGLSITAWWSESPELKDFGARKNSNYDVGSFLSYNSKRYTLTYGFNYGADSLIWPGIQSFRRLATAAGAELPELITSKLPFGIRPANAYYETGIFERWMSLLWKIETDNQPDPIIREDQCMAIIFDRPFRQSIDAVEALITATTDPTDGLKLSELQQQVFDHIKAHGPKSGKELVNELGLASESALTTHIIPALKLLGVKNRKGVGYYLPS